MVDCKLIFPEWNPRMLTYYRVIDNLDSKDALKAFGDSSRGFISNKIVREIIMIKSNYECVYCKSIEFLQIDHILSVYHCFKNDLIKYCNKKENLQVLCRKCNTSKLP